MARDKPRRRATPAIELKDKSSPRAVAKIAPRALKPYRVQMRQLSKFSNFEAERTLVLGVYVLTQTHKKAFLHTNFEYRPLQIVRGCGEVRERRKISELQRHTILNADTATATHRTLPRISLLNDIHTYCICASS